ncbi:MAG: hypothetical protein PHF84_07565 [bacterium]|nr:hypothetical protein [bacterium]
MLEFLTTININQELPKNTRSATIHDALGRRNDITAIKQGGRRLATSIGRY